MYATRSHDLGHERPFPTDFNQLGLKFDEHGRITTKTGGAFKYWICTRSRVVVLHYEGVLEAIRQYVTKRLLAHNIKPIFVTADLSIARTMPQKAHIPIITTDPRLLHQKKAVIIVVGEHTLDPILFTEYGATGEAGMHQSSLLNIAAHLTVWEHLNVLRASGQTINYAAVTSGSSILPFEPDVQLESENTPGVIVLNPGQRIYSYQHNKTFTLGSWIARPRSWTQPGAFAVNKQYNYIARHKTEDEHVETFFRYLLPQLVDPDAKICLIGIGQGAQSALMSLDNILGENPDHSLGRQLSKTTLIASTHDHKLLKSEVLLQHLAGAAIAWQRDESPKNTVLGEPLRSPHSTSQPIAIHKKPSPTPDVATSGRHREPSPLALKLEEAKQRGELGSFSTSSKSSSSGKDFVPFQNTDFSPAPTAATDEIFPMQGTPSMEKKAQEDRALIDSDRQLIAQIRKVPSLTRERVTNWVVAGHTPSADPNETPASPVCGTASDGKEDEEAWIPAGPGHDNLEDLGISGQNDSGDDSDDRLFIAGHNRPRGAAPVASKLVIITNAAPSDSVMQDNASKTASESQSIDANVTAGNNGATENDTAVVEPAA